MTALAPSLLLLALLGRHASAQFVCSMPSAGCTNGIFNQAKCECECIPPFCHDANGDCNDPSNSCGGNPWEKCTRGVNCPWWVNPLKAESCTTGPKVPLGLWEIYNTETVCCNSNFAYSDTCITEPVADLPTKHPTIAAPEDDIYEVIPIKFDVRGLPDSVKMRDLKDEMQTVLRRILLRLSERIDGLKISDIEERVVLGRKLLNTLRFLAKDVTLYFNVYAIRDDDKTFGPLIIQEVRDSYDEIIQEIQTFTDTQYFGGDLDLSLCSSQGGKFNFCAPEIPELPPPRRAPPVYIESEPQDGGFPGWGIALIVIFLLLLFGCAGYLIYAAFFSYDERDEGTKYFDDERSLQSGYASRRSRKALMDGSNRSGGSRTEASFPKALTNGDEEPMLALPPAHEDESVSIRSGRSRGTKATRGTRASRGTRGTKGTRGTRSSRRKPGRDPTMYVPGQEDRPDPDSEQSDLLMITDGGNGSARNKYMEDPPIKPKREPTMYVEGDYDAMEDPPLKPKREPTMYAEGEKDPTMYIEGGDDPASEYGVRPDLRRDPTMYDPNDSGTTNDNSAAYGVSPGNRGFGESARTAASSRYTEASVEEVYNDARFPYNQRTAYDTDDSRRRDGTYYDGRSSSPDASFRTEDPSAATEDPSEAGSRRSRGSRADRRGSAAGSRGTASFGGNPLRKSIESDWRGSLPDFDVNTSSELRRQTKSFHK